MDKIKRLTYTMDEMAEALGIGRNTAYKLAKTPGFPVIHICGKFLIPIDALNKWIDQQITHGHDDNVG